MLERFIDLKIDQAYAKLRVILIDRGGKIVFEEQPKRISIKHGSLNGVTPKGAKKVITYDFITRASGTRVVSYSSISSDWAYLTLWGNIIAGFVAAVFWWIATDIQVFLVHGASGYWTWFAQAFKYPDIQYAFLMANVIKMLSIFLVIVILLEILDVYVVRRKIDTFASLTLDELEQR